MVRGIRGATTIDRDTAENVVEATRELLETVVRENGLTQENLISVMFTATPDIRSEFPARAARAMGWNQVPLSCFQEMDVQGALPLCIRALLLVSCDSPREQIKHVYLRGASILREDL